MATKSKQTKAKKPASKPTAKAKRLGARAAMEAAAASGKLPSPPNFKAETHRRFRPMLAEAVALAKAGDLKGLKALKVPTYSSSPKAIARYRDLAVMALEARK